MRVGGKKRKKKNSGFSRGCTEYQQCMNSQKNARRAVEGQKHGGSGQVTTWQLYRDLWQLQDRGRDNQLNFFWTASLIKNKELKTSGPEEMAELLPTTAAWTFLQASSIQPWGAHCLLEGPLFPVRSWHRSSWQDCWLKDQRTKANAWLDILRGDSEVSSRFHNWGSGARCQQGEEAFIRLVTDQKRKGISSSKYAGLLSGVKLRWQLPHDDIKQSEFVCFSDFMPITGVFPLSLTSSVPSPVSQSQPPPPASKPQGVFHC